MVVANMDNVFTYLISISQCVGAIKLATYDPLPQEKWVSASTHYWKQLC